MNKLSFSVIALFSAVGGACTSYNPDLGATPFLCGSTDPKCPEGYACMDTGGKQVCVSANGDTTDGSTSGFQCNDDSSLGMNDAISGAFQTPVDSPKTDFSLAGLAICPPGDKDNYGINLAMANKGLRVTTSWDSGQPVNVSILNSTGNSIANGTPKGDKSMTACAPNLVTTGTMTFYASAFMAANQQNNYRLQITVVNDCVTQ